MRRVTRAIILSLSTAPLAMGPAALAASQSALTPGKPAGVRQAQEQDSMLPLAVFGAAAVGIGIALAVSDNDTDTPGTPPPTTTTTTGTAP